jgi:UDP-glucose 4-epimerase
MHEIMVSEEEIHHCVRRGEYLVIRPMLPELRRDGASEANALAKEFSSEDTVIDLPSTAALLGKHRLTVEETPAGELLR